MVADRVSKYDPRGLMAAALGSGRDHDAGNPFNPNGVPTDPSSEPAELGGSEADGGGGGGAVEAGASRRCKSQLRT